MNQKCVVHLFYCNLPVVDYVCFTCQDVHQRIEEREQHEREATDIEQRVRFFGMIQTRWRIKGTEDSTLEKA